MCAREIVPLYVEVPRPLRVRVRVLAASREQTLTKFVVEALEAALASGEGGEHAER